MLSERVVFRGCVHRNALDALTKALWMVNTTPWPADLVGGEPARAGALAQIQRDHIQSPKLAPLCQRVSYGFCQEYEPFLRAVLDKNRDRGVRGNECFGRWIAIGNFLGPSVTPLAQFVVCAQDRNAPDKVVPPARDISGAGAAALVRQ